MFLNRRLNRKILNYLALQSYFKSAEDIYRELNLTQIKFAQFDLQLKSLAAKRKLLMVPLQEVYRYSKPLTLKNGQILSGLVDTHTYLLLISMPEV